MPSAAEFKKAFHLQDGTKLGALGSIHNAKVGHVAVKRNERYEFPATLEIELPKTQKKKITRRQLITALQEHTSGEKIVYSSYGSPYECTVHDVAVTDYSEENIAEMKFLGKAVRRRDIPTLAQQKAEERKEKGGKIEEEQVSQDGTHLFLIFFLPFFLSKEESRHFLRMQIFTPGSVMNGVLSNLALVLRRATNVGTKLTPASKLLKRKMTLSAEIGCMSPVLWPTLNRSMAVYAAANDTRKKHKQMLRKDAPHSSSF